MPYKAAIKAIVLTLGLFLSLSSWGAWNEISEDAQEALKLKPDMYNGMQIFRTCTKCHYKSGWGQHNGDIPQIAGQHPKVLIKQLTDVRDYKRETSGMDHFIMLSMIDSAQALADVAAYTADILMTPEPGIGPGTDLEHGKTLFATYCVPCHGENGEGSNEKFFPRIQGQHYKYLLRQFDWIYRRERLNAHPGMMGAITNFSNRDSEAVIDYISRIKPPKEDVAPSTDWENPDFD